MSAFYSCDWGTTSFRLRQVDTASGRVLHETRTDEGARAIFSRQAPDDERGRADAFEAVLRHHLLQGAPLPAGQAGVPLRVFVSGMASSTIGWREVPYASVPFALDGSCVRQETLDLDLDAGRPARVQLISGLATHSEMMRGEETELLGLFAKGAWPGLSEDCMVLLPGTHAKHARVKGRNVIGFRTFMTGELFELLATHSLLKASVAPAHERAPLDLTESREAFLQGVRKSQQPGLAASLFQTRIRTVLQHLPTRTNHWFLSGLLIGTELATLNTAKEVCPVMIAAPPATSTAYRLALETVVEGREIVIVPPEEVAVASVRAHQLLLER